MKYGQRKKPIYVSAAEKAANREILESYAKRFPPKRCRTTAVFRKDGSKQEYVETARYFDLEEAERETGAFLAKLNELSDGRWRLVSLTQSGFDPEPED